MDEENLKFHKGQYENPYRSTIKFADFLMKYTGNKKEMSLIDIGCGVGAVLDYIVKTPAICFVVALA